MITKTVEKLLFNLIGPILTTIFCSYKIEQSLASVGLPSRQLHRVHAIPALVAAENKENETGHYTTVPCQCLRTHVTMVDDSEIIMTVKDMSAYG